MMALGEGIEQDFVYPKMIERKRNNNTIHDNNSFDYMKVSQLHNDCNRTSVLSIASAILYMIIYSLRFT